LGEAKQVLYTHVARLHWTALDFVLMEVNETNINRQSLQPSLTPSKKRRRTYNRVVAKVVPVLLVGAAGFATWVYIAEICGNLNSE
jgi:nitrate reductase NapE component